MDDYSLAESALKVISATGHIVSGHDKNPIYPAKNWQYHDNQVSLQAAMTAWRAWGSVARGVGIVCRDEFVVLDFDPIDKASKLQPEHFEARKLWRAKFAHNLYRITYTEQSRSGNGCHFVMRVSNNFVGRRGIEYFKRYYAIDILTGARYCDITGMEYNGLPPCDGDGLIARYLTNIEAAHVDTDGDSGVTYERGQYTSACIAEILTFVHVDPENYDGWLEIGMSLFNETNGSQAGLMLWDDWSRAKGGDKYRGLDSLEYKWRTFKSGQGIRGGYGMGSIIRIAKLSSCPVAKIRLRHSAWKGHDQVAKTMVFSK